MGNRLGLVAGQGIELALHIDHLLLQTFDLGVFLSGVVVRGVSVLMARFGLL